MLKLTSGANDSKIPFAPLGGRFCETNFLRYLDLCYVNPAYYKSKTFPLLQAAIQSETSRNCHRKISYLRGKDYFAAFGIPKGKIQKKALENMLCDDIQDNG